MSICFRYGLLLALGLMTHAHADDRKRNEIISGSSSVLLMKDFVSTGEFAIPAVLYFDGEGCLTWSSFGLKENWIDSLDARLSRGSRDCGQPTAQAALDALATEGVAISEARSGRPILIWYGSDRMCPDCASKKTTHWPELVARLPEHTLLFDIDIKS